MIFLQNNSLLLHYTGSIETFTAPVSGKYKLECWGAQGSSIFGESDAYPGLGGYATGNKQVDSNVSLFICVGSSDSYNNNNNTGNTNGGGCTSVTTTNRGELRAFKNFKEEVVIVAGGGGGIERPGKGGAGGGLSGIDGIAYGSNEHGIYPHGTGGSQTAGGTSNLGSSYYSSATIVPADFGVGGSAYFYTSSNDFGSKGGSGWYGGGGSAYAGAGGGGSSYYGGTTDGSTIDGNHSMPSPSGSTETGHSGHGACIITYPAF